MLRPVGELYEAGDFAGDVETRPGGFQKSGLVDEMGSAARFKSPTELAVDDNGNVFVADSGNRIIRMITPDGTVTSLGPNHKSEWMGKPGGVATGADGTLYVLDRPNHRIFKVELHPAQ